MRTPPTDQRRLRQHRFLGRRLPALVIRTAFATGAVFAALAAAQDAPRAQERRILSPPGHSAVQVGGNFDPVQYGYLGGAWIDVYYGRPLKRGRDLFGPPDWAEMLNDGAPVWRAGANQSTRLVTETALLIAGTRVEPGEYTLFIDLSDTGLDVHRLHLARPGDLRLREPRRAVRRLRVHGRPRCPAHPDGAGDPAGSLRPALVAVPRHDRERGTTGADLGHEDGVGGVHRRGLTRAGARLQSNRSASTGSIPAARRAGPTQATTVAAASTASTVASVTGSRGDVCTSRLSIRRPTANAPADPTISPAPHLREPADAGLPRSPVRAGRRAPCGCRSPASVASPSTP